MRWWISPFRYGHRSTCSFQFPFHRDVLCDDALRRSRRNSIAGLSVPFSSGCALRWDNAPSWSFNSFPFSSLFIGMCFAIRGGREIERTVCACSFSSLFIGMCFAIQGYTMYRKKAMILSVPFSSGCALRSILCGDNYRWMGVFQFPFHRDVLCDPSYGVRLIFAIASFQFPFHRDVLCDLPPTYHQPTNLPHLSVPFSSGCALR